LAIGAAAFACSSFSADDEPSRPVGVAADAGDAAVAIIDAASPTEAGAPRFLYVYGGYTREDAGAVIAVPEAFRAPLTGDGELGEWERRTDLDVSAIEGGWLVTPHGTFVSISGSAEAVHLSAEVRTAPPDGAWANATPLPSERTAPIVATDGVDVFAGGDTQGNSPSTEILSAPLVDDERTVGPWTTRGTMPPHGGSLLAMNGSLYAIGGPSVLLESGTFEAATVSSVAASSSGTLGAWRDAGGLPGTSRGVDRGRAIVVDGAIVFTGLLTVDNTSSRNAYLGTPTADGALVWTQAADLPEGARTAESCIAVDPEQHVVYLVGGRDSYDAISADIFAGRVDVATRTIQWRKLARPLPIARAQPGCAIR
jgi:hypothetical protein